MSDDAKVNENEIKCDKKILVLDEEKRLQKLDYIELWRI